MKNMEQVIALLPIPNIFQVPHFTGRRLSDTLLKIRQMTHIGPTVETAQEGGSLLIIHNNNSDTQSLLI